MQGFDVALRDCYSMNDAQHTRAARARKGLAVTTAQRSWLKIVDRVLTDKEHGDALDAILDEAMRRGITSSNVERRSHEIDAIIAHLNVKGFEMDNGSRMRMGESNIHALGAAAHEQLQLGDE